MIIFCYFQFGKHIEKGPFTVSQREKTDQKFEEIFSIWKVPILGKGHLQCLRKKN